MQVQFSKNCNSTFNQVGLSGVFPSIADNFSSKLQFYLLTACILDEKHSNLCNKTPMISKKSSRIVKIWIRCLCTKDTVRNRNVSSYYICAFFLLKQIIFHPAKTPSERRFLQPNGQSLHAFRALPADHILFNAPLCRHLLLPLYMNIAVPFIPKYVPAL